MDGRLWTVVVNFDVAVFVTFQKTIATLVTLLSKSSSYAFAANLTNCAAKKVEVKIFLKNPKLKEPTRKYVLL